MKKEYKNKVFNFLKEKGLEIDMFNYQEYSNESWDRFQINYGNTKLMFQFFTPSDSYHNFQVRYTTFSPGYKLSSDEPMGGFFSIDRAIDKFKYWVDRHLNEYIKEQNEPDLWELQKQRPKILMKDIIFDTPEREFTTIEKEALLKEVNKLKGLLLQKTSSPENNEKIEKEIAAIKEALNTKSNFDWFHLLIDKSVDLSLLVAFEYRHEISYAIKGIFEFYSAFLHQLGQ